MSIDAAILREFELFSVFPEHDLRSIAGILVVRNLREGEVLLRQAERRGGFFLVLSGRLVAVRELAGLTDVMLARLERGDVVGYLSNIDGEPRTATVRAMDHVQVAEMSDTEFRLLLTSNSALGLRFQLAIAQDMVKALRIANKRFTVAATLPAGEFASPRHIDGTIGEIGIYNLEEVDALDDDRDEDEK